MNRDHWVTTDTHFTITEQVCSLLESFTRSHRDYSNLGILALAWLRVPRFLSRTRKLARLFSRTPARHTFALKALTQTHKASEALLPSTSFARRLQKKFKAIMARPGLGGLRKSGHGYQSSLRSQAAGGKALALVLSYVSTGWDCSIRDH